MLRVLLRHVAQPLQNGAEDHAAPLEFALRKWKTRRAEEAERAEIRREYNKKMSNLPSNCPNCGAPTCGKMYCEYCESKMV